MVVADRLAVAAGGIARRRLRTDAMTRLLAAGPALLRGGHSAQWSATVVDRIDALDGFFARWLPASSLAIAGPLLVLAAVAVVDWRAASSWPPPGCWSRWPRRCPASAPPSPPAASSPRSAACRRASSTGCAGIATIVLAGRAADEAAALAAAADELRGRTMRVLRVAFLSSAALDCALALALVILALRYGVAAATGRLDPAPALFVLLLVPEFFAPLRAFAVAYQDRMQAAAPLTTCPTCPHCRSPRPRPPSAPWRPAASPSRSSMSASPGTPPAARPCRM